MQHASEQVKDTNKNNISIGKLKNRIPISLANVSFANNNNSITKQKPRIVGRNASNAKETNRTADKFDCSAAFAMDCAVKCYEKLHLEDSNRLQCSQIYSIKKGLKKFDEKIWADAIKEMTYLHRHAAIEHADVNTLQRLKRKRSIESLIFLI